MRVRKAVVPCAGLGTRFLPATLAVPKELLPLDRKPAIHHIVQEAADCGIETVVLVLSKGKESILHYFLQSEEALFRLKSPEHRELVEEVRSIAGRIELIAVYQQEPLGLGHAVLTAATPVGSEPFLLMLPDDHFSPSPVDEMASLHEQHGKGIVALRQVGDEEVSRYGIVTVSSAELPVYSLCGAVEKPAVEDAQSDLAILGRYILPPETFELLSTAPKGVNGEIQITDSLDRLAREQGMLGLRIPGREPCLRILMVGFTN